MAELTDEVTKKNLSSGKPNPPFPPPRISFYSATSAAYLIDVGAHYRNYSRKGPVIELAFDNAKSKESSYLLSS